MGKRVSLEDQGEPAAADQRAVPSERPKKNQTKLAIVAAGLFAASGVIFWLTSSSSPLNESDGAGIDTDIGLPANNTSGTHPGHTASDSPASVPNNTSRQTSPESVQIEHPGTPNRAAHPGGGG